MNAIVLAQVAAFLVAAACAAALILRPLFHRLREVTA